MPYSANSLISGLDALTIAGGDLLVLADISDSNRAKKLTADELDTYLAATTKTLTNKTLVAPVLGTPASGVLTNCTGTASGLTAGNVTTNANLTGHITSTGNAAILGSFTFAQLNTAVSDAEIARTNSTNTFTDVQTFSSDPIIPDEAYGSGWNGVLEPPTKNAVYDKIETILPATFKTGQTSRATGSGTGTQNIAHGLSTTPKLVKITATDKTASNVTMTISVGTATSTSDETCTYFTPNSTGTLTTGQDNTHILLTRTSGATSWSATLSALDSTNITLNFDSAGDATVYIQWEAYA